MVYPTMPFNAPARLISGRTFARRLVSGTGSAYPRSPFPPASERTECPRSTYRWSACREADAKVLSLAHAYEKQSKRFGAPA